MSKYQILVSGMLVFSFVAGAWATTPPPVTDGDSAVDVPPADAAWVESLGTHKLSEGLAREASRLVEKEMSYLRGESETERAEMLFSVAAPFFPNIVTTPLPSSGTVHILTILAKFKDTASVALTRDQVYEMLHGAEDPAKGPYDSMKAYYERASGGVLHIEGDVLDWVTLSKNQGEYKPDISKCGTDEDCVKEAYTAGWHALIKEVMELAGKDCDFSAYENEVVGRVNVVNIVYAGDSGDWGSFWWAYAFDREKHLSPAQQAEWNFNGHVLNNCTVEPVRIKDNEGNFHLLSACTFIHEMAHVLGLADYYNTRNGAWMLGTLDPMDACQGNHNAFSRWVLGWIEPYVIGSGSAETIELSAAGLRSGEVPAIAIFPNMASGDIPAHEFFMIENRYMVGNDGVNSGMPGDGLLVWRVDASRDATGMFFQNDNTTTERRILQVVPNGSERIKPGCKATRRDYFVKDCEFCKPKSNSTDGQETNIRMKVDSSPSEKVTVEIGFKKPSPSPGAGAPPPVPAPPAQGETGLIKRLENLSDGLVTAPPEEVKAEFERVQSMPEGVERTLSMRVVLAAMARKQGAETMKVLEDLSKKEPAFVNESLPLYMEAWSASKPEEAAKYIERNGDILRDMSNRGAGARAVTRVLEWQTTADPKAAEKTLRQLGEQGTPQEMEGALRGFTNGLKRSGMTDPQINETLTRQAERRPLLEPALKNQQLQDAVERVDNVKMRQMMQEHYFNVRSPGL